MTNLDLTIPALICGFLIIVWFAWKIQGISDKLDDMKVASNKTKGTQTP